VYVIAPKCKQLFFHRIKHVKFRAKKEYLRGILLHYFIQKKSAAHRILVETYGDHPLSEITCRDWFRCFKNNNFDVEDKERSGAPKKFEELEALFHEDSCQTLAELIEPLGIDHTTVSER